MPGTLAKIDAVVLAGGQGTRIAGVLGSTPKVLAPIGGTTFLDLLLVRLEAAGLERVVLCLGHLAERVLAHLSGRAPDRLSVIPVVEPAPLGTAGALRFAMKQLHSDPVLVLNGDSAVEVELAGVVSEHQKSGAEASMLCVEVADARRYGRVIVGRQGNVERFVEKDPSSAGPALINAGLYCFGRQALDRLAGSDGPSLERDFLEKLQPSALHAVVRQGAFIDIGTPESLSGATAFFRESRRPVGEDS
ncbi:MAG: NTP transferase domain-containing protein [Proteobacteria bacterium]|nr:NTP transferase domain-containing protein [Pseudomonadota bacterium]MBI3498795.1 NTP transferase domain-containing protein [Pseudomonadota bacterium]